MNTHIDRIRKLVALQHVDDDIYAIEQELKTAPEEVEELARRFAGQEEQRNRILDKLQHLREQQKRLEQDIEGENSRIKKSKSKLMQVVYNVIDNAIKYTPRAGSVHVDMARAGKSVIMVSSEMPELLGVCDRILVMSGGRLAGEVQAAATTQEEIMTLAAKYV